ncbi:MAG: hypothetical protein JO165_02560 [Candidatus Eremiobacteraeota bacterium]|nr:hypothetical protein [Candidatus Eremiobacteraeota bacterium]
MKLRVVFLAAIVALGAFAACNSGGSNNTPASPCTIPASSVSVVYPAPNATGVPGAFQQIIVAVSSPLPSSWNAVIQYTDPVNALQTRGGNQVVTVSPPFPTPSATPSFANPVYQSSAFPSLVVPSNVTVSVFLNDLNSGCTPTSVSSFTTQ